MTPFPIEPVGWLIEQCVDDIFLFSSDYPHPEGGKDPLARFESSMTGTGEAAKRRSGEAAKRRSGEAAKTQFYSGNFADMLGMSPVPV